MSDEIQFCEQFIYTTAEINHKKGYQVIARSSGINNNMIDRLSNYLYPIGISPSSHKTSKSLVIIDDKYVAYSIVKNIGVGYDGRSGTLYNHTIITNIKNFEKLNFNSKVFDKYTIIDYKIRGTLEQLKIKPIKDNIELSYLKKYDRDFLIIILSTMMNNHKFAVINDTDIDLIQNLLLVLPNNMRLVPFSTQVVKPNKQPNYKIIQSSFRIQAKLNDDFIIIDKNSSKYDEQLICPNAKKLIDAICSNNKQKIRTIQDELLKEIQKEQTLHDELQTDFNVPNIDKLYNIIENNEFLLLHKIIVQLYDKSRYNEYAIDISAKIRKKLENLHILYDKKYLNKENLIILLSISKIILDYLNNMKNKKTKKINKKISQIIRKENNNYQSLVNSYLDEIRNYF